MAEKNQFTILGSRSSDPVLMVEVPTPFGASTLYPPLMIVIACQAQQNGSVGTLTDWLTDALASTYP